MSFFQHPLGFSVIISQYTAKQGASMTTTNNFLNEIKAALHSPLTQVDQTIISALNSEIPLIDEIAQHIISGQGKRIRPLMVILTSLSAQTDQDIAVKLAVIIELVHTATLLHDDVVDGSLRRRGLTTANALWGDEASVLVGDFVYSRSFQLMTELQSFSILTTLSEATNTIAEGEVMQLGARQNPALTEAYYLDVIYRKTAKLFEAGAILGALYHQANPTITQALKTFGRQFGMAYQITDDLLDYTGNSDKLGKNIGDDLAEGKVTLPLIIACKQAPKTLGKKIPTLITNPDRSQLHALLPDIQTCGALDYTAQLANEYLLTARAALNTLPKTSSLDLLHRLCDFVQQRQF